MDAVVVGGGPAGSTCARLLKKQNKDVLLIDKDEFPREKACAGWITPAVIESLDLDLVDYAKHNVLQPLYGFHIGMIGEKNVRIDYGKPMSYGIRRSEFDYYLLAEARVPVLAKTTVKSIDRHGDNWLVNGEIETPLLVGAGGHFCPVAKKMGAKPGQNEAIVAAQEIEFKMNDEQVSLCNADAEVPELYFCRDLKGYGWLFRKGRYLNIGLGREDSHNLSSHVDEFINELQSNNRIPANMEKKLAGHAYQLYGSAQRQLTDDGLLLIGDAAGLAYSHSGEGIRPAIESAILAANAICNCRGEYSTTRLRAYVQDIEKRFGTRKQNNQISISNILPNKLKQKIAAKALSNNWFSRKYVLNKWFLHLDQDPLRPLH